LQGFLFLAVGMTLLFFVFPTLRERSHHHTSKFPTFHNLILKMESYIERIIGKV
jgi:type II secretory pathway component PulF